MLSCQSRHVKKDGELHISDEQYGRDHIVQREIPKDSLEGAWLFLHKNRHDFGKISSRKTPEITIEFEIENTGKLPLVIFKADTCASDEVGTAGQSTYSREAATPHFTKCSMTGVDRIEDA